MSAVEIRIVANEEENIRLDRWFKRHFPWIGNSYLQRLVRTGQIRVEGKRVKASKRLVTGQRIRIPPLVEKAEGKTSKVVTLHKADADYILSLVIFRDDWFIALNKPQGLAVQGGSNTVRHVDAMLGALKNNKGERIRLIHRLDKDTSGVLLLANTVDAASKLSAVFQRRAVTKLYWAVTVGIPKLVEGEIDCSLSKQSGRGGERMIVTSPNGRRAITHYKVIGTVKGRLALVALMPTTGRTHQIRVHMAAIDTPILGDGKYGGKSSFIDEYESARTLHLHARRISLTHPSGTGKIDIIADLPKHMEETLIHFGLDSVKSDDPFGQFSSTSGQENFANK